MKVLFLNKDDTDDLDNLEHELSIKNVSEESMRKGLLVIIQKIKELADTEIILR